MKRLLSLLIVAFSIMSLTPAAAAGQTNRLPRVMAYAPEDQPEDLFYAEARTVYLGNLERRAAGLAPLRWNRELTLAARWFSWDSIANRDYGWVGHVDTQGGEPADRALEYGYLGSAGAENAGWSSGSLTPEALIGMWMGSVGHQRNLLRAGSTEIGVGIFTNGSGQPTYATQDFGSDPYFPALIIENEAPQTTSQQVSLYQYGSSQNGLTGMGAPVQMMVSNSACFGTEWQAYEQERSWTLPAGSGWKQVYTRIRDALGRTSNASDSIYLGADLPTATLSLNQLSQTNSAVNLYELNGGGLSSAQFSLGWALDDADFKNLWDGGTRESSAGALGGTAYRLDPNGSHAIWAYPNTFVANTPMLAYFRLKTDRRLPGAAAQITVEANGVQNTIDIPGTAFTAANQWQEFVVPFTYLDNTSISSLWFRVASTGSATIHADVMTIFTAPQSFTTNFTWNVPGGRYRGQGVWVRYSNADGSAYTAFSEASTAGGFSASPSSLSMMAETGAPTAYATIQVSDACAAQNASENWTVVQAPEWLEIANDNGALRVRARSGSTGAFNGDLVLRSTDSGQTTKVSVRLMVVAELTQVFIPILER